MLFVVGAKFLRLTCESYSCQWKHRKRISPAGTLENGRARRCALPVDIHYNEEKRSSRVWVDVFVQQDGAFAGIFSRELVKRGRSSTDSV